MTARTIAAASALEIAEREHRTAMSARRNAERDVRHLERLLTAARLADGEARVALVHAADAERDARTELRDALAAADAERRGGSR